MLKRAHIYSKNPCSVCKEAKSFLKEHGVLFTERDVTASPLSKDELETVLGYHNPKHYLNTASSVFKKKKLDKKMPARNELLEIIEENPDLLRYPIIVSGRLMTIGGNRQQLIDMLRLTVSDNGSGDDESGNGDDNK